MAKAINFEGQTYNFPDDATDQEISGALSQHILSNPKPFKVNLNGPQFAASQADPQAITPKPATGPQGLSSDSGTSSSPNQTPVISGLASILPLLGSIGGSLAEPGIGTALGGAAGSFAKQAISPDQPSAKGLGTDLLLNSAIPGGLESEVGQSLLNGAKGLAGKLAARMVNSNNPIVKSTLGKAAESFMSPPTPALDMASKLAEDTGPTTVSASKGTILDDYKAGKTPDQVATKLVSDPREAQKLNLATGTPAITENLALTHAVSQGYNSVSHEFDPGAILKELGTHSEGYDAALQPGTKDRLTDFLNTAKNLEPSKTGSTMMSYTKHRLLWDLGGVAAGGVTAGIHGLAAGGTIMLGAEALSRITSSDTLGNLAMQSLKLAPDSPASPMIAKILLNGLRGTQLIMASKDGKDQKVTVGEDGSLVPVATKAQ